MAHHGLTTTQRNWVFEAIRQVELDPADFEWVGQNSEVTRPDTVDLLRHNPTNSFFVFDVDIEDAIIYPIFAPGRDGFRNALDAPGGWGQVVQLVLEWLERVKREHDAPDLWKALEEQQALISDEIVENTPFTPDEQLRIAAHLNETKEYVRATFQLEPAQHDKVEAQLDYLVDAARRSRRIDWRNLLVGSLISQALQAVLPVDLVQQLLFVVLRGLADMFGGGGESELPGGPPELT